MKGCEDLLNNGHAESGVYVVDDDSDTNDEGRAYNARYCDQATSGGGWTVKKIPSAAASLTLLLISMLGA